MQRPWFCPCMNSLCCWEGLEKMRIVPSEERMCGYSHSHRRKVPFADTVLCFKLVRLSAAIRFKSLLHLSQTWSYLWISERFCVQSYLVPGPYSDSVSSTYTSDSTICLCLPTSPTSLLVSSWLARPWHFHTRRWSLWTLCLKLLVLLQSLLPTLLHLQHKRSFFFSVLKSCSSLW